MTEEMKSCPKCKCPYGYLQNGNLYVCPECQNQWEFNDSTIDYSEIVLDANGNRLNDGDNIIIIKNLPVKGAPKPLKAGTKVKNIRLSKGDHNINCKINGFGSMALKSEFVKKA